MKTVKEVAEMAGVSVRTIHYYDEIGLLKPTVINESGYRLYDDAALKALQQILLETYGDKAALMEAVNNPPGSGEMEAYQRKIDIICRGLAECMREGHSARDLEVKMLICEYAFAAKEAFKVKNEQRLVLGMADTYRDYPEAGEMLDQQYGEPGFSEYLAKCIREFYGVSGI